MEVECALKQQLSKLKQFYILNVKQFVANANQYHNSFFFLRKDNKYIASFLI